MAYITVKDSTGTTQAVLVASGDGTVGSPFVSTVQLAAGTAAIGKLTTNSGVTIGAVEIAAAQTIGLAAGSAVIGHVIVDSGTIVLGAGSAVVGHFILDSGTVTTVSTVTNLSQLGGAAVPIGAGVEATAIRVTLPTDGTGVVKLGAGSAVVGHFIVDSGTITAVTTVGTITNVVHVDDNSGSLTIDGNVGSLPLTSGGLTPYSALSAGAVLTAQIKGSAGQIYSIEVFNTNAAARFVRLYNQTGAPASTDGANIIWRGIIPGNATGTGFVVRWPHGLACATGIGIRASAAVADNDATVLGTNDLTFNVSYK